MDVPVQRGEDEPVVGDDDARDRSREAAEPVAGLRPERADVEEGGELEEADSTVREAAGEVGVGEGEAPADQAVRVLHVGRVEV